MADFHKPWLLYVMTLSKVSPDCNFQKPPMMTNKNLTKTYFTQITLIFREKLESNFSRNIWIWFWWEKLETNFSLKNDRHLSFGMQ